MLALFLANPPPYMRPHTGQAEGGSEEQLPLSPGAGEAEGLASPPAAAPSCTPGQPQRGGTLVVCPPALLQQWQAEISNHTHGALTVEVYDGLRGLTGALEERGGTGSGGGAKRQKPAQREAELYNRLLAGEEVAASFDAEAEVAAALRRLQQADVVLTSFDVLRAEVGGWWFVPVGLARGQAAVSQSADKWRAAMAGYEHRCCYAMLLVAQVYFVPSARSLRRPKKYAVPHCPLLQVRSVCPQSCFVAGHAVMPLAGTSVGNCWVGQGHAGRAVVCRSTAWRRCRCTGGGW
jgi:hypothetical protein